MTGREVFVVLSGTGVEAGDWSGHCDLWHDDTPDPRAFVAVSWEDASSGGGIVAWFAPGPDGPWWDDDGVPGPTLGEVLAEGVGLPVARPNTGEPFDYPLPPDTRWRVVAVSAGWER